MVPLTIEEMESHVAKLSYWRKFLIRLQPRLVGTFDSYLDVILQMNSMDVNHPTREIQVMYRGEMPWPKNLYHFEHELVKLFYNAESHEIHEWLRIDGIPIVDPHPQFTKTVN